MQTIVLRRFGDVHDGARAHFLRTNPCLSWRRCRRSARACASDRVPQFEWRCKEWLAPPLTVMTVLA